MSVTGTIRTYALAPLQQGMLFHHLSGGPGGVDLEQIVGRLDEDLDVDRFRRAWSLIAGRHDAFACRFRWEGVPSPVHEVGAPAGPELETRDLRGVDAGTREAEIDAYLRRDRESGFDLASGPLVRLMLFRCGDAEYRLVWSFPHIVMDGSSFPIVLREVFEAYEALGAGGEPALEEPVRFEGFIDWLAARDGSGDEAFWRGLLAGIESPTPLPGAAVPTSGAGPSERRSVTASLPADVTDRLRRIAEENGFTLSTVVNGAWALLLARHSGEEDVVFGATRACRRGTIDGADRVVGCFINTLPVRARIDPTASTLDLLRALREQQVAVRAHEHASLADVQRWTDLPAGSRLFDSIVVYDHARLGTVLGSLGEAWANRDFELVERTSFPLTLNAYGEAELVLKLSCDAPPFDDVTARRLVDHLATLLEGIADDPTRAAGEQPILTADERTELLETWNATAEPIQAECVHRAFEAQAAATPTATALVFEDRELTYAELNGRANRLANHLQRLGVGTESLVGLYIDRSIEMMVGLLAIQKAGAAYVPLDPAYPRDRIAFMLEDSGLAVVLAMEAAAGRLPATDARVVRLDADWDEIARESDANPDVDVRPDHLAYVIYTSGSTGRPKGVMVEHRNVSNFFGAMDRLLGRPADATWLAVTSLSFDISVLELLWTLSRGLKVVIFREDRGAAAPAAANRAAAPRSKVDFSLFYFSSDEGENAGSEKYRLLLEGAKFADANGFVAVWTPERHFHEFGGLFPNPSVTSAAVSAITERVGIRAGSVVLPLHHAARIAEEWAVVDNLSDGRVGIAFAAGWQPNDFALRPEAYADRSGLLFAGIEQVRALWRGEEVAFDGPKGPVSVRTLPRPVQPELPVWVTSAGSPETFRRAGEIGANILTHMLGQTVDDIAANLAVYREAWTAAGHEGRGTVSIMLHTFVGEDRDEVRERVRAPMITYLRSAVSLVRNFATSWTAYSKRARDAMRAADDEFTRLAPEDLEALLEFSFERYFETSGLFGTPDDCVAMVERLSAIGVDEVACLIDFGVDAGTVVRHLPLLAEVRERCAAGPSREAPATGAGAYTLADQVGRHGVTHLQCTPSMARMLLLEENTRRALAAIPNILIGGEAFPPDLADDLLRLGAGRVFNMYGPTETTIWSTAHRVAGGENPVPIGTPIANTRVYVLDRQGGPVPAGVAGELYIGGAGVVRGYLGRDELTAERFVADPFSREPGARLYRTGDRVRHRFDGSLEFLGRLDHQVKVRGHRIELGEIESVLKAHEAVRDAIVIVREDEPGDARIVAYVVPAGADGPAVADLRGHLRAMLPEFMVPAAFVSLNALPLTPNAKIDRKALPAPEAAPVESGAAFVPPRSDVERVIADVWREVLRLPRVGTRDNFFDLGGHSLLAVQVHSRLRAATGRPITLTDLFRFPTIEALAAHLSDGNGGDQEAVRQSLSRAEARRESMKRRTGRRS